MLQGLLNKLETLNHGWPSKLIAYVQMPDHVHLICNPRDGRIIEFTRDLKSRAAKAIFEGNHALKLYRNGRWASNLAGEFYGIWAMDRLDDLAED